MGFAKHTKILTVFSFLRLRSTDIYWYQWVYPSIIFAAFSGFYFILGRHWFAFDHEKLFGDVNTLMGILVGFYIAALAAVSSFTNENLDQLMRGRAPTLTQHRQGQAIKETLTRRRFLSILFGYCAFVAIILYAFGVLQAHVTILPTLAPWMLMANECAAFVAWSLYLWLLASLLVVTLLGLHYLIDRMHRA